MPPLYLVDGFNFLHAVILVGRDRARWWRVENQQRVLDWCAASSLAESGAEIWVVFDQRDGAEPAALAGGAAGVPLAAAGVQTRHAPDADEFIVARCGELSGQRAVVVVTADRSLADRARHRGARACSPWSFARDFRARPPG